MNKYNISPKAREAVKLMGFICICAGFTLMSLIILRTVFSPPPEPVAETSQVEAPARIKLEGGGSGLVITNCTFGHTFDDLLDAIEWVESKGEAGMMGDAEPIILERKVGATAEVKFRAIGAYQIHKIYVDDVNRIVSQHRQTYLAEDRLTEFVAVPICYDKIYQFTYADRWDRQKSRAMTYIYIQYYEEQSQTKHPYGLPVDQLVFERMARIHNGGPNGWKKESTKPYWEKVKARMDLAYNDQCAREEMK